MEARWAYSTVLGVRGRASVYPPLSLAYHNDTSSSHLCPLSPYRNQSHGLTPQFLPFSHRSAIRSRFLPFIGPASVGLPFWNNIDELAAAGGPWGRHTVRQRGELYHLE